jgi:hypothetical protein
VRARSVTSFGGLVLRCDRCETSAGLSPWSCVMLQDGRAWGLSSLRGYCVQPFNRCWCSGTGQVLATMLWGNVIFASEDDPGARDEQGKLVPLDVEAGDIVLFGKWRAGQNAMSNLPRPTVQSSFRNVVH